MGRLERDGYKSTSYRVDLYSRLTLALTPLIMIILGLGLALRHNEIHLTSIVALGMGLMFAYWLFIGFCASFGQAGRWPALLAVTFPHLICGVATLGLLRRVKGSAPGQPPGRLTTVVSRLRRLFCQNSCHCNTLSRTILVRRPGIGLTALLSMTNNR